MSFCILHSIQHRSVNSWPLKRVHYVNMMYCMAQREILCTLISMTVIHLGGQQAMKPKIGTIQELGKHHTAYSCFPFWCLPHIFNAKALTKCPCHQPMAICHTRLCMAAGQGARQKARSQKLEYRLNTRVTTAMGLVRSQCTNKRKVKRTLTAKNGA